MKIVKNELICCFDVDDTLVMWDHRDKKTNAHTFLDPYDGSQHQLVPHKKHIKLLKDFKSRGYTIIVWSGGGYKWAESVVRTLKLEKYVDFCMSKSTKYVDDLQADEVLGSRIYLKHEDE